MDLQTIAYYARIKGLDIVGTGDITHPRWFDEVSSFLEEEQPDSGLYRLREKRDFPLRFMITAEVATVYEQGGRSRRIHHCLLVPSLEVASQVSDRLADTGDLSSDGRPVLSISSPELVERMTSISDLIEIFPAHAWTPWWSLFGANNAFDSLGECYQDQLHRIHAIETGLSSDPPMNWRLSSLDGYTLLSNSDCHSPYPYRLGREANVFELEDPTYRKIVDTIRAKDSRRLLFTIETSPEYGKYHWTGHRDCGVSMPSGEAVKLGNRCPKCGRKMTIGVEYRVEQLSDRESGYVPPGAPGFKHVLPLQEALAAMLGESSPVGRKVMKVYDLIVSAFGSELTAILDAPLDAIESVAGGGVTRVIARMREDSLRVAPGYDGVYGRLLLNDQDISKVEEGSLRGRFRQLNLD